VNFENLQRSNILPLLVTLIEFDCFKEFRRFTKSAENRPATGFIGGLLQVASAHERALFLKLSAIFSVAIFLLIQ